MDLKIGLLIIPSGVLKVRHTKNGCSVSILCKSDIASLYPNFALKKTKAKSKRQVTA